MQICQQEKSVKNSYSKLNRIFTITRCLVERTIDRLHLKQTARIWNNNKEKTISRNTRISWTYNSSRERVREREEHMGYRKFICSSLELPLNFSVTLFLVLPFVLLPHTKGKHSTNKQTNKLQTIQLRL